MANRRDFLKHLGFHSKPPPMTNKQQPKNVSPELQSQINRVALQLYPLSGRSHEGVPIDFNGEVRDAWINGASTYCILLQSEQEKTKAAEGMLEKMAKDLELIVKWCNAADIKAVATDNPVHMAVYHSLHQSMQALTEYLKFKSKKDGTVNG